MSQYRHQYHTITPHISTVANRLQNLTLQPHPASNEWVTGCLVCGKSYDQVIKQTVADYLNQTAQPGETVRERQIKRNVFIDGIQSGVFNFIHPGVSQAAACDGLIYSVTCNGQNSSMQGYALPLFEEKSDKTLIKIIYWINFVPPQFHKFWSISIY